MSSFLADIILNTFVRPAQGLEGTFQMHCGYVAFLPKLDSQANLLLKNHFNGLIGAQLPTLEKVVLPTYHTLIRVIEPLHQLDRGAFPAATVPNQGHHLPPLNLQAEAFQDLDIRSSWIGEMNTIELQIAFDVVWFVSSL